MSIQSQFQAIQLIKNSIFWNSSYRNFDATSEEAQKFLSENNFIVLKSEDKAKNYTYISSVLTGYDSVSYKSTRPLTEEIYHTVNLPLYIEEDKNNEVLAKKLEKYESRKAEYLQAGKKARTITKEEFLAEHISRLQEGVTLEGRNQTEKDIYQLHANICNQTSYDHVELFLH